METPVQSCSNSEHRSTQCKADRARVETKDRGVNVVVSTEQQSKGPSRPNLIATADHEKRRLASNYHESEEQLIVVAPPRLQLEILFLASDEAEDAEG